MRLDCYFEGKTNGSRAQCGNPLMVKSDNVGCFLFFNILNICATLFQMLHHCMTCNASQYLQNNHAYVKPIK